MKMTMKRDVCEINKGKFYYNTNIKTQLSKHTLTYLNGVQ